ncbi:uncharacterized protein V1518DRAFT_455633 [Limtongia smithiae]|uniref:uncharacterized protein n=1 Tax=Limtongia smithiae TaxID=1125753 RepID=UPI0034CD4F9D
MSCCKRKNSYDGSRFESKFPIYDGGSTRITRTRTITSCLSCYRRKVKCNKVTPQCAQCEALNIKCEYRTSVVADARKPRLEESKTPVVKLEEQEEKIFGFLSVDKFTGESRYATLAHWGAMFDEIDDILDHGSANSVSSTSDHMYELSKYLPPRRAADELFDEYLRHVQPFAPMFERRDIIRRYKEFWDTYPTSSSLSHFACVMFAVFFLATTSRADRIKYVPGESILRDSSPYDTEIAMYQHGAELALKICDFAKRPSLLCLVGASMLQICVSRVYSVDTNGEIARFVRAAQLMGMHRDPSLFANMRLDPVDSRLRRAVWWHLICLDVNGSVWQGLPSITQTDNYDVQLPEEDFDYEEEVLAQVLANGKYLATRCLSNQLNEIYGISKIKNSTFQRLSLEVEDFRKDMTNRIERISAMTFATRHAETSLSALQTIQRLAIKYLSLLSSRAYMMLYHPNFEGWSFNRVDVVKAAMKMLRLHLEYSRLPDCLEFLWYVRLAQPLHGLNIVLRDICQNPNEAINDRDEEELQQDGVDPRVQLVEETLARARFMRSNELSEYARLQWNAIFRIQNLISKKLRNDENTAGIFECNDASSACACTVSSSVSDTLVDGSAMQIQRFMTPLQVSSMPPGEDDLSLYLLDIDWAQYGFE